MFKNTLFITVILASVLMFMSSCEKDKGLMEKRDVNLQESNLTEKQLSVEKDIAMSYYLDGIRIKENPFQLREKNKEEIKHIMIVFEKITNGKRKEISINSFKTDKAYIEWGKRKNIPISKMLNKERKLQEFIKENKIIEKYNEKRVIPKLYKDFEAKLFNDSNKALLPITIYKNLSGGGAWIVQNTLATLAWTAWNNNISRYMDHSLYGGVSWYDKSWYRNKIATTWNYGWSFIKFENQLKYLDNKTTSLINW